MKHIKISILRAKRGDKYSSTNNGERISIERKKESISPDSIIPSFPQLSLRRNSRLSSSRIEREIVESWFHGSSMGLSLLAPSERPIEEGEGCRKKKWFLKRQAGLRDVYFRSVGDPPTVSERRLTVAGSLLSESLSLVNLAANKTKGYSFVNELARMQRRNWPSAGSTARDHE